jgi:hypothetical protein
MNYSLVLPAIFALAHLARAAAAKAALQAAVIFLLRFCGAAAPALVPRALAHLALAAAEIAARPAALNPLFFLGFLATSVAV